MIGYLAGLTLGKDEKSLVVLTQGVGYRVQVPAETLSKARPDEKIQLYIHTSLRQDGIFLYGFSSAQELEFFNQLISVSGVGPKTALEILSAPLHLTQNAISSGDASMLTRIKGLGKKTAERLILELKGKVTPATLQKGGQALTDSDALSALENLGYEKRHVITVLSQLPGNVHGTQAIIKYFLKNA